MLRFLPGLLLVQVAAAAAALAAINVSGGIAWTLALALASVSTIAVSLWFNSITDHVRKDAITSLRDQHSRERESLLVSAEAEKRFVVEESHRRILEESSRAHARANFKLGAAVAALGSIAAVLLYVELFTLALVTATTAGGALAGYITRARQETGSLRRWPARLVEGGQADVAERGVTLLSRSPSEKTPRGKV